MNKVTERPTPEEREAIAEDIREGGEAAGELLAEEIGLTDKTPILDEADKEMAEGGGPIAEVVAEIEGEDDSD